MVCLLIFDGFFTGKFIEKMVGKPLGWGPLNNQPHIHHIYSGYLLGISPLKGLFGGLNS